MKWEFQSKDGIEFLTIPQWETFGVQAVFTLRQGGISAKPYASLNLAFHVDDKPGDVLANRSVLLKALACPAADCVAGEQVHGTKVMVVTARDKRRGIMDRDSALDACDGLATREPIALMGFYADCTPLYFCSPDQGLVALAHAGWKGTVHNITREMMAVMRQLGGDPADCLAAIGPCIGPCCYEVGEDVAAVFRENFNERLVLEETRDHKYRLDLRAANRELMLAAGIRPHHIVTADWCTSCHPDLFFSYRREGLTGRMAAFIRQKEGV